MKKQTNHCLCDYQCHAFLEILSFELLFLFTPAAAAKSLQSRPTLCKPHRRQPTRLPRPWDSPGKNTGVGCHFLLQCMKVKSWKWNRSVMSDSLQPHGLQPTRLLRPWDFPGKSTGVGCHCLLHFSPLPLDKTLGYQCQLVTRLVPNLAYGSFPMLYWESKMLFESMWVMTVKKSPINLLFLLFCFEYIFDYLK